MKRWVIFPLLVVMAFSLVACAPWQRTEERLITKLESLSLEMEETQAELRNQLDQLLEQLSDVSTKVEQLSELEVQLQAIKKKTENLSGELEALDWRIREFDVEISKLHSRAEQIHSNLIARFEKAELRLDQLLQNTQQIAEFEEKEQEQLLAKLTRMEDTLKASQEKTASSVESLRTRVDTLETSILGHLDQERDLLNDLFVVSTDINKKLASLPLISADIESVLSNQKHLKKTLDTMTRAVDLEGLKNSVDEIKFLLKVVKGVGITEEATEMLEHIVRPGETLQAISRAYGVTVEKIMQANPSVKDPSKIYAYQKLLIPVKIEDVLSASALLERHIKTKLDWENLQSVVVHTFGEVEEGYANVGVDLRLDAGEIITAPVGGRIEFAGVLNESYGNTVRLLVGEGNYVVFGRLREIFVKTGDMVQSGEALGRTGISNVNLHLEIWRDGVPLDPLTFFFKHLGELHVTMYTEWDDGKPPIHPTFKRTATGSFVRAYRTVAADFDFLPPGSLIYIPFFKDWPNRGFFVVEDTGGAVVGKKLDVFVHDPELATRFSRYLDVYLVAKGDVREIR